jgi:argonaute-like protein implicated in RNA metabolism and viral defense
MDDDKIAQELIKTARAFANPIDFEQLINHKILTQIGRSYYIRDINLLPEDVRKRIKTIAQTKHGLRVSFHKESKSLKKLASQYSYLLEEK